MLECATKVRVYSMINNALLCYIICIGIFHFGWTALCLCTALNLFIYNCIFHVCCNSMIFSHSLHEIHLQYFFSFSFSNVMRTTTYTNVAECERTKKERYEYFGFHCGAMNGANECKATKYINCFLHNTNISIPRSAAQTRFAYIWLNHYLTSAERKIIWN